MIKKFSRREAIVSAATAAAVLGLDKSVLFPASAWAQDAAGSGAKGFHRFRVGDIEVVQLYDGVWEKPHDPGFISNATVAETKAALRAAGLNDASVPIPFTVTVLKSNGKTIMFDAGTGAQLAPTAGKLAGNMAAAGIDPKTIGTIVITHFQPDHIFGLMYK